MDWVEIIVSVLTGLAALTPMVVALVRAVRTAAKEKNWDILMDMVMGFMKEAETKFATGAERKDYVLIAIKASAVSINFDIDLNVVADMIDKLCAMSKVVNAPATEAVADAPAEA